MTREDDLAAKGRIDDIFTLTNHVQSVSLFLKNVSKRFEIFIRAQAYRPFTHIPIFLTNVFVLTACGQKA